MGSANRTNEVGIPLTPGNAVDGTQFSDTEPKIKVGRMKSFDDAITDVVTTAPMLPSLTRAKPSAA